MKRPSTPGADARRASLRLGWRAEWIASFWLWAKGYQILARRYLVKGGEIDLIVRRGHTIAFVEVKARATLEAAEFAIDSAKIRRISLAVRVWLTRNPWAMHETLRGDAVYVARGRLPRHTPTAYTLRV